jgi:segregation and condensation protein A
MIQVAEQAELVGASRDYLVRLDNFEGPLDLLLHLIKQDAVEIWEISISRITRQYLEYLELMEALNIEIAGEFLVMAATLMRIKSQGLLPRPPAPGDEDEPTTEEELIQRLLAYRLFKEVAESLRRQQDEAGPRFPRGFVPRLPDDFVYPLAEVDLFTLVKALAEVEARDVPPAPVHHVQLEDVRLEDQVELVLRRLEEHEGRVTFGGLFGPEPRRLELAVTFLALLELARQQVVVLMQDQPFAELWIVSRECEGVVNS